jgi:hypothetical protein
MASILKREIKFYAYVSIELKSKISDTLAHETRPVSPPAFSECLAVDAAVIERRDGAFESEQSRNGIEIFKYPWGSVTGRVQSSWPSHAEVLLRLCRFPRMASRGERMSWGRARWWWGDRLLRHGRSAIPRLA